MCTHTRTVKGHWQSEGGEDIWVDDHEVPTTRDIDLHRYECTKCGKVMYYSEAARRYYEEGITCSVKGLEG
ncbi:hypothetical protein [Neptuniibacter sp. QD37_11]|uniref:hypothetical protein n=1 Tax=Neptuniibacter sp. QD37_11 TaxID=3398209 RepID=UPI0039F55E86